MRPNVLSLNRSIGDPIGTTQVGINKPLEYGVQGRAC